ncbi:TVP38/TMEM64 family protein [Cyanothece sp. BG0011]|uniref:TVP38/TMEM64 family protein n=1 Tax=Cyanothece sp. BG0011 TaxID=2082950 RepID=UPI000D1DBD83|nr:TVP38/TMEM64 family protein [Cyanothece sp. BG0011]
MLKTTKSRQRLLKLGGIAVLTVATIILIKQLGIVDAFSITETLQNLLQWIQDLGTIGYLIFTLVYILSAILLIPASILTLGAGAIFNVVKGSILVSIASMLGAIVAFLIGRYLARGWVSKQIEKYPKFQVVDEAVAQEGWKIVGLTRLSPVLPFVILNYAFGITQVSLKDYITASWFGMLPGTIMYVYIGSLIGNIATLGAGGRERTSLEWALYIVGLIATVLVTVYVTKLSQNALNNQIEKS